MIYLATGSLSTGVGLGLAARLGARRSWSTTVPRPLHHAAFAASCVSLAWVTVRDLRRDPVVALTNAAALLVLAALPRTSGGGPNHVRVASLASALHGVAVAAHLRTPPVSRRSLVSLRR